MTTINPHVTAHLGGGNSTTAQQLAHHPKPALAAAATPKQVPANNSARLQAPSAFAPGLHGQS